MDLSIWSYIGAVIVVAPIGFSTHMLMHLFKFVHKPTLRANNLGLFVFTLPIPIIMLWGLESQKWSVLMAIVAGLSHALGGIIADKLFPWLEKEDLKRLRRLRHLNREKEMAVVVVMLVAVAVVALPLLVAQFLRTQPVLDARALEAIRKNWLAIGFVLGFEMHVYVTVMIWKYAPKLRANLAYVGFDLMPAVVAALLLSWLVHDMDYEISTKLAYASLVPVCFGFGKIIGMWYMPISWQPGANWEEVDWPNVRAIDGIVDAFLSLPSLVLLLIKESLFARAVAMVAGILVMVMLINYQGHLLYTAKQNSKAANYLSKPGMTYVAPETVADATWFLYQIGAYGLDDLGVPGATTEYQGYEDWYLAAERASSLKCAETPFQVNLDERVNLVRNGEVVNYITTTQTPWTVDSQYDDVYWNIVPVGYFNYYFRLDHWTNDGDCGWHRNIQVVPIRP